jgi:protein-tyrosine-phosphatase
MQSKQPKILFVCKGNMFRSPIAEAIAGRIIGKENVSSAGTYTGAPDEPEGQRLMDISHHSVFCQYMEDQGFKDFGEHRTRRVTEKMVDEADVVVDMSEPEYDLDFVSQNQKTVRWEVENPLFKNLNFEDGYKKVEEIYDILEKNIKELLNR